MGIRAEKSGARIMGYWARDLRAFLNSVGGDRLVLLGVGNPIKGDDSVGLFIAGRLRGLLGSSPRLSVQTAAAHPESALSKVDLESSRLLIFDAVEAGGPAGSIVMANVGETQYGFFATHNFPLRLMPSIAGHYEKVSVLGVEPGGLGIGESLTPVVRDSAETVVSEVERQLRKSGDLLG